MMRQHRLEQEALLEKQRLRQQEFLAKQHSDLNSAGLSSQSKDNQSLGTAKPLRQLDEEIGANLEDGENGV